MGETHLVREPLILFKLIRRDEPGHIKLLPARLQVLSYVHGNAAGVTQVP